MTFKDLLIAHLTKLINNMTKTTYQLKKYTKEAALMFKRYRESASNQHI